MDPFGRPDNRHVRVKKKRDDDDDFNSILFTDNRQRRKPVQEINENQMINGRRSLGMDALLKNKNDNSAQSRIHIRMESSRQNNSAQLRTQNREESSRQYSSAQLRTQNKEEPVRQRRQQSSKKQSSSRSTHSSSRVAKPTSISESQQKPPEKTPLNFPFDTTNLEDCRKWNTLLQSTFNTKNVNKDDLRRFIRVIKKAGGLNAFIEKETNNYYSTKNLSSQETYNYDKNLPRTSQQVHEDFETITEASNHHESLNSSHISELNLIKDIPNIATHGAKTIEKKKNKTSRSLKYASATMSRHAKQLDSNSPKYDRNSNSVNNLPTSETNNDDEKDTSGAYKQSEDKPFTQNTQSLSSPAPPPPAPPPPPPLTAPTSATLAFKSNTPLESKKASTITEAIKNVQLTSYTSEIKDNSAKTDMNEAIRVGIKLRKITEEDKSKANDERGDEKQELCDLLAFQVNNLRERMRMNDLYSLEDSEDSWDDD